MGDVIDAYFARPFGAGPYPGIVVIHHMSGWDEAHREIARVFAWFEKYLKSPTH